MLDLSCHSRAAAGDVETKEVVGLLVGSAQPRLGLERARILVEAGAACWHDGRDIPPAAAVDALADQHGPRARAEGIDHEKHAAAVVVHCHELHTADDGASFDTVHVEDIRMTGPEELRTVAAAQFDYW